MPEKFSKTIACTGQSGRSLAIIQAEKRSDEAYKAYWGFIDLDNVDHQNGCLTLFRNQYTIKILESVGENETKTLAIEETSDEDNRGPNSVLVVTVTVLDPEKQTDVENSFTWKPGEGICFDFSCPIFFNEDCRIGELPECNCPEQESAACSLDCVSPS
jgi:hypothetical protein